MGEKYRSGHRKLKKNSGIKQPSLVSVIESGRSVLLTRRHGGLGDILMTRPLLHSIKEQNRSLHLTYALPKIYHQAVIDVEDIDALVDLEDCPDRLAFGWSGDISTACLRYEMAYRKRVSLHRSEIWSGHIGLSLSSKTTQFRFTREEIEIARSVLSLVAGDGPYMLIAPYSADRSRNLTDEMIDAACTWANRNGLKPIIVHDKEVNDRWCSITGISIREWMALFTQARMCFCTDTSALHMAGYLGVPTVGIFGYTSGVTITKYYPNTRCVQLHNLDPDGLECCPCYDWGSCRYKERGVNELPLRCIKDIDVKRIVTTLDEAFAINMEGELNFKTGHVSASKIAVKIVADVIKKSASEPKHRTFFVDTRGYGVAGDLMACALANAIVGSCSDCSIWIMSDDQRGVMHACPFVMDSPCPNNAEVIKLSDAPGSMIATIRERLGIDMTISGCGVNVMRSDELMIDENVLKHVALSATRDGIVREDQVQLPTMETLGVIVHAVRSAAKVIVDDPVMMEAIKLAGANMETRR